MFKLAFSSFLLTVTLFTGLSAKTDKFDDQYGVKIVRSFGSHRPNAQKNNWITFNFITCTNGLYTVQTTYLPDEAQAKQASEQRFSGKVNIVWNEKKSNFKLVFEQNSHPPLEVDLKLNRSHKFSRLPRITSITENEDVIKHWFSKEYKYRYVIELNDGSKWITKASPIKWEMWEPGSRIIKIGNHQNITFVNMDASLELENANVSFINDLEPAY